MEGRHCLSAATVISGLAGEVPSEAAAQESKYLSKLFINIHIKIITLICSFPLYSVALINYSESVIPSLPLSDSFPLTPSHFMHIYLSFLPSPLAYLNIFSSLCLSQVRQRVSAGSSSGRREQRSRDVGSNTVSTSCRTLRSC